MDSTNEPQNEAPHVFGEHRNLMGVMNLAEESGSRKDIAVVMVTAGMVHQVGPYRLHVELARQLAEKSIPSFRFDLSGIGESIAVGTKGTSLQRASKEIGQAMDLIESTYGIDQFFLFGLCSGADDSFYAAQEDKRVKGAAFMDGCGYRTSRYTIHKLLSHYLRRSISPQRWIDVVNRRINTEKSENTTIPVGDDIREFPEQREAAMQIQNLVDRDVRMRFLYTGGVAEYYNYEKQFWDMFADVNFNQYVSTVFYPDIDHVAFLEEDRQVLIGDIVNWAANNIDDVKKVAEQAAVDARRIAEEKAAAALAQQALSSEGSNEGNDLPPVAPAPIVPPISLPSASDHPSPGAEC